MNIQFNRFFHQATGKLKPYPYQRRFATGETLPQLLSIPTGVGKTATTILGWLWRRRFADDQVKQKTPRRLVYCLPMRTLVEQTRDECLRWLDRLNLLAGEVTYANSDSSQSIESYSIDLETDENRKQIGVHILMGGTDDERWYEYPERDAILIGTQDMLLSRALNRGYGMSRYAWPVQYALLNNDCLWVMDETQLMGVGLTTSAQLAGLRAKLQTFGNSPTLWTSATLDASALATADHPLPVSGSWTSLTIEGDDREHESVARLLSAEKPCCRADVALAPDTKKNYPQVFAEEVLQSHRAGTLTLAVLNRVTRAQELFQALQKQRAQESDVPEVQLVHSRFRPHDRQKTQAAALDETAIPAGGRILVATQAVEAGVDISATTLFTELAPWSSIVQRLGRCNRRGTCGLDGMPPAQVYWIDIDTSEPKKAAEAALPYEPQSLDRSRERLNERDAAGPLSLETIQVDEPRPIPHVIRRKDVLELFDTTSDLSGNDLDISRYIRDSDDTDVQVYWRQWDRRDEQLSGFPPKPTTSDGNVEFPAPGREELCAVSVAALRGKTGFIGRAGKKDFRCYNWNSLDRQWQIVRPDAVRPGMTLLFHADAGGYDADLGWTGDPKHSPVVDCRPDNKRLPDAMDQEEPGQPIEIGEHLRKVGQEAEALQQLPEPTPMPSDVPWDAVIRAAWWHDVGKAHAAFQGAVQAQNEELDPNRLWAKSGTRGYLAYQIALDDQDTVQKRPGFRHELASALAWLDQHKDEPNADLIAYLIAAHHGKVRLSIRSMPNESRPPDAGRLFARGIWDGDELPRIEIGNGEGDVSQPVRLSLDLMQLGQHNGQPSWLSRTLALREQFGPFRLAYLETLVRVADWRGSKDPSGIQETTP